MRKLIVFLGMIPSKIKKIATQSLPYLDKIIAALQSQTAIVITSIIPGTEDELLRETLIAVFSSFEEALKAVSTIEAKKALVARMGAETLAKMDGNQQRITKYIQWFEAVYEKQTA